MPNTEGILPPLTLIFVAMMFHGGCAPEVVHRSAVSNPEFGPFIKTMATVFPGPLDRKNRYLPVVKISTPSNKNAAECSGVLISPRLVLTAGHCVCSTRPLSAGDEQKVRAAVGKTMKSAPVRARGEVSRAVLRGSDAIADGASCAPFSTVTAIAYPPISADGTAPGDGAYLSYTAEEYDSERIQPHDDFMVVYNGQWTNFKEADLAIIVLNRPIKSSFPPVRLTTVPVAQGDRIVMVGYGFGERGKKSPSHGHRHFAPSVVVKVHTSDSPNVRFDVREQPKDGGVPSSTYAGDSGGPCFSEADESVLVGISTGITSEDPMKKRSVFTSIYPHREWVKKVAQELGEKL